MYFIFTFQDLSITLMFTYLTVTLHLMFSDSDLKMQTTVLLLHNAFIPLLLSRNSLLNKLQSTDVVPLQ